MRKLNECLNKLDKVPTYGMLFVLSGIILGVSIVGTVLLNWWMM